VAVVDHVLRTERLVLRPVTAEDHAVLRAHWAAPDVRRFLFDGATLSAAEITEAIEDSARDFGRAGYGLWLIHETGRTDLVGTAGLRPLEDLGLEIFYSLAPGSWSRGYATEAARAVLDHALGPLGLPEVLAEVPLPQEIPGPPPPPGSRHDPGSLLWCVRCVVSLRGKFFVIMFS
jgi:ribosomal-protein-alanine N-acetyltransferase